MAQTTNHVPTAAIENRIDKTVTTGLAISRNGPATPIFSNMGEILEFAKIMAISGIALRKHLRNNPGACAAICMQAQRWQMDPYMVANKSFEVNDQIAFEAQLIASVVNTRAPIKGRLKTRFVGTGTNRRCVAYATFIGEDEPTEVESPPFSMIQPKNSPLWKNDPDQQLAYYTQRLWARRCCPEILLGVYDIDEIGPGAQVSGDGLRDVTPPRPRLEDFQKAEEPEPEPEAPAEMPFAFITADGEERSFTEASDACQAFAEHMKEVAAGGQDAVNGLWDSNGLLLTTLREAGFDAFADRLNKRWTDLLDSLRVPAQPSEDWPTMAKGWTAMLKAAKTLEALDSAYGRIKDKLQQCHDEAPEIAEEVLGLLTERQNALRPDEAEGKGLL